MLKDLRKSRLHATLWRIWAVSDTILSYDRWIYETVGIRFHIAEDIYEFKNELHFNSFLLQWGEVDNSDAMYQLYEMSDDHPEYFEKA